MTLNNLGLENQFFHWEGLFNFLFGTADQKDIHMIKQQVKDLYSNQLSEKKVLQDVISVTNISRGLINEIG